MSKSQILLILLGVAALLGLLYYFKSKNQAIITQNIDPNTFSNIDEIKMIRWNLTFNIDFNTTTISGEQIITFISQVDGVQRINLDSKGLQISSVKQIKNGTQESLHFKMKTNSKLSFLGEQIAINLEKPLEAGESIVISIDYKTSANAEALSWLTPEQTGSKTQPYLFSQCEPISCRSILPFQDTPSNKVLWKATAIVPKDIKVFLSSNMTESYIKEDKGYYTFESSLPMATYVFAIVAGNVELKKVGKRTGVITEPIFMDSYSKELSDLEKYLETLESYIGPYVWGVYNIVVLPPSFPLGGMENPLLTFASPTIIVGDKSGVFVAIHEIAHSWTGNLLTCVNWESLWLNEGFAVFLERKTSRTLFGQEFWNGEAFDGNVSLNDAIKTFGQNSEYTKLHPSMIGRDPNSGTNECPYEKGFQFLTYIENLIGEDKMKEMLQGFISQYSFKSIDVYAFNNYVINFIRQNFPNTKNQILSKINFNEWEETSGYTPVPLSIDSKAVNQAINLAQEFISGQGKIVPPDSNILPTLVKVNQYIFLETLTKLNANATAAVVDQLDGLYNLSSKSDAEILQRWFTFTTSINYTKNLPIIEKFLGAVGRMKMIIPLYTNIAKFNKPLAKQIFENNKSFYHPLAVLAIKPLVE